MAVFALTSLTTSINSVDYTDHLKSSVLTLDAAQLDTTDFSSGGWVEMIGGLKSGTLQLNWMDDVADNDVDEELFALLGTVVTFAVKATSAGISASNPEYQGSVLITGHTIGGGVGELAQKSLTFPLTGAVVRDIIA
jgi:hypothetical protein